MELPSKGDGVAEERLKRLVRSPICPVEDAKEYASELKQLASKATDDKKMRVTSRFFKALGDETRLKILELLQIREMCVCEIMVALDLTQPATSHHLGILENANLIRRRREGRWVFYRIADPKLIPFLDEGEKISSSH